MTERQKENLIGWLIVGPIVFAMFYGMVYVALQIGDYNRTDKPCQEYVNYRLKDVPARCIQELTGDE